jgi:hypothetical protein
MGDRRGAMHPGCLRRVRIEFTAFHHADTVILPLILLWFRRHGFFPSIGLRRLIVLSHIKGYKNPATPATAWGRFSRDLLILMIWIAHGALITAPAMPYNEDEDVAVDACNHCVCHVDFATSRSTNM